MIPTIIPVDSFASNDQSLCYLAKIFGSMYVIPQMGTCTGIAQGGSISLLGTMFQTFNSIILSVAALVVVYVTVVGVMHTAHEGQFMGKNWNNLWLPIRTVLGIAALVPTGSGYSGIQIVMMWFIVQGVGAADMLWNSALGYVQATGSPYAQVSIPSVGISNALITLFEDLVCDSSSRQDFANPYTPGQTAGGYYRATPGNSSFASKGDFKIGDNSGKTTFQLGPQGACGSFTSCDQNAVCSGSKPIACEACKAQNKSLDTIIPILQGIADNFVQADYAYQKFYFDSRNPVLQGQRPPQPPQWVQAYCTANHVTPCSGLSSDLPDPNLGKTDVTNDTINNLYWPYAMGGPQLGNFIDTVTGTYLTDVGTAVNNYIKSQNQNQLANKTLQDAQKTGWILAGSYYFAISSMSGNNLKDAIPALDVKEGDLTDQDNILTKNQYRNNFAAASTLIADAFNQGGASDGGGVQDGGGQQAGGGIGSAIPKLSRMDSVLGNGNNSVKDAFGKGISGQSGTSPLIAIVAVGQTLLYIAEVLFIAFLAVTFSAGILGAISVFALGNGAMNPVTPGMTLTYFVIMPMLLALLGVLVSTGGLLAVYIPLIPYVVFTMGAISWMLTCVEAMVAGPLVALGILSPSGQHDLLGKSEPAMMLLFSIFLRPSLMIFGLMAAMLLATVVVQMINAAFWNVMIQASGGKATTGAEIGMALRLALNPLEIVLFICAYVSLIFTALNKCFAAIYLIPQKTMEWMGGRFAGEAGGEEAALSETKGGVSRGAGAAAGAGAWAGEKAKAGREAHYKAKTQFAAGQSSGGFSAS